MQNRRRTSLLVGLILVCGLVECTLTLADRGVIGSTHWRRYAYEFGGFWPGLLRSWLPNYPQQPYAMFFSYGFLHGGFLHMAVNMVTLWSLGRVVLERVGIRGFAVLYLAAMLGGAGAFGMLADTLQPMVGASGALFGLAGGVLAWNYVDRFTLREKLWPVARAVGLLILMNIVMWWALDGQMAWQTHLGGFLSGWTFALLIDPRGRNDP
ncbi:rhomboid family intramembrane serine protease [Roseobacter sp.]|uniref:rhomboid family intramembrane serine protease n=1 Tax=Roseobacter sp. TaxID=1907202 RepID=UPI0032972668